MSKKTAVVGAGVGGLATAARLSSRGHDVTVYEKLDAPGGRANIIEDKGFKFDTGPSFVLMPGFFEEFFSYCGKKLSDNLNLKRLDIHYHIFYPNGKKLTVYCDNERTKEELERFEKGAAKSYQNFLDEVAVIYKKVETLLFHSYRPRDLLNPRYLPLLFQIKPFQSYWQIARKYFKNLDLVYAFTFESMFIGVSPFQAPAFYSIVTYVDHVQKIFHPMGGMYQIPLAFERMARDFGAKMHYGEGVEAIEKKGKKFVVKTAKGDSMFDNVVCNADYAYAQERLLGRNLPEHKYSCSVYLLYLGLNSKLTGLDHHNLFFSSDLKKNLFDVFEAKIYPEDPSFYVHVPTITDPGLAPQGKDIAYILIPVPNLQGATTGITEHKQTLRRVVFDRVKQAIGIDLEKMIEVEHSFYPQDFIDRYNVKYGATFGLAHTLMQSAFFRPPNRHPALENLYFVGASTQPGGGLPPVIASSRIVADLLQAAA